MTEARVEQIRRVLEKCFAPTELKVRDQSQLHAGHEGAKDGKGHFAITIVSAAFEGQNRLARHRMVYDALHLLLQTDIHALRVTASAPSEQ